MDRLHARTDRLRTLLSEATARIQSATPNQRWRRWAGGSLFALVLLSASSIATRKKAIEAYITADVITITSPIDGIVTAENIDAGELFQPKTTLIAVEVTRDDATEIKDRQIRLNQVNAELSALEDELITFSGVHVRRLEAQTFIAERALEDLNAQLNLYITKANNYEKLTKVGAISQGQLNEVKAMRESYRQRSAQQQQTLNHLRLELAEIQKDPTDKATLLKHSSRQMEMMDIELLRNLSRRKNLLIRQQELDQDLKYSKANADFNYKPTFPGMVLTSRFSIGDEVNDGSALLTVVNCHDLKVEALFESSKIRDWSVGHQLRIHRPGKSKKMTATVVSFRGEQGLNGLQTSGVAKFRPAHVDRTRVLIAIPNHEQPNLECRLGERVAVEG